MDQSPDVDAAVARIDRLLDEFGERMDARARVKAEELVQALMEIYGTGLRRILDIVGEAGDAAEPVLDRLAEDKIVASLLLIHGLHPIDAGTRIRRALARIEPRVQLLGITDGVATLRPESGSFTTASAELVERTVLDAAPEVEQVEIDGVEQPGRKPPLVQIAPGPAL